MANPVNNTYAQTQTVVNTPGGGNTMVQFNQSGKFGGDNGFTYDTKTKNLKVQGNINVGGWVKGKIYTNTFNFFLTGGANGQVLSTDGYGNLIWSNVSGSGNFGNGNVTAGNIIISDTIYTYNLSSTGTSSLTTLNVNGVASFSSVNNVKIPGGTSGQVLSTDGANNLSWITITGSTYSNANVASYLTSQGITNYSNSNVEAYLIANPQTGTYSNTNVASYLTSQGITNYSNSNVASYLLSQGITNYSNTNATSLLASFGSNTITTTGNITANYYFGNGSQLTGINGSNVTGYVANANVANFAYSVSAANVTGLGNIATINKDGNSSNVLYGNGVFAAKPTTNPAGSNTQIQFNDAGSFGATGNLTFDKSTNTLDVNGPVVAGTGSQLGGLTNPVISGTGSVDNYLQIDNWNASNTANASSDFIAYPNNGTDASGWIDVGITSNAFSQASYSVTTQNEGYVFMSAPSGSGRSGNLVLATDSTGSNNSIEFYVGGFNQTKNGTTRKLLLDTNNATVNGNIIASTDVYAVGNVWANSGILRTTSTSANVFNSNATTVNIAGAASLAVNIGNSSGRVNLLGNVQGNTNGFAIGYRDIPQVSFTGSATLALSDAGKHYYSTLSTANTLTVPNNSSVAFVTGTAINIINQGTGNITIAQGVGVTIYMAGNSTSGNRTLSSYGLATLQKVATDTWFLVGVGLA